MISDIDLVPLISNADRGKPSHTDGDRDDRRSELGARPSHLQSFPVQTPGSRALDQAQTDASGQATFGYSMAVVGTDFVVAQFVNSECHMIYFTWPK